MAVTKKNSILTRLSCVAIALPGIASASGADGKISTDFQVGHYNESDQRIKVDVYEASISAPVPVGKETTFNLGLIKDIISGASPMFTLKDPTTGKPKQVLSGASIKEERNVMNVALSTALSAVNLSISGGISSENDYLSRYTAIGVSKELNGKMTTLGLSVSSAWDKIDPTGKTISERKRNKMISLNWTQIIDANSLNSAGLSFSDIGGYLSDPYKLSYFTTGGIMPENRPDGRNEVVFSNRYIRNFKSLNHAAMHLDYRYYRNNWGVDSHMMEINWHQPIADGWEFVPKFRYYTQSAANFYQPYYTAAQTYFSSDYRLADFGAVTYGFNIKKELYTASGQSKFHFRAGIEYYDRRASYKLGSGDSDGFADYNSYLATASIKYTF